MPRLQPWGQTTMTSPPTPEELRAKLTEVRESLKHARQQRDEYADLARRALNALPENAARQIELEHTNELLDRIAQETRLETAEGLLRNIRNIGPRRRTSICPAFASSVTTS